MKRLLAITLGVALAFTGTATLAASLMPQGKQAYFDANGDPLAGGKVYTYAAGTSTPLATYSDQAGTTPNANPVVLDARGEATIFWAPSAYKVVLKDSADVTIWTQDDIYPVGAEALKLYSGGSASAPELTWGDDTNSGLYLIGADNVGLSVGGTKRWDYGAAGSTLTGTFDVSGATSVGGALRVAGATTLVDPVTVSSDITVSGNVTVSGTTTVQTPTAAAHATTKAYVDDRTWNVEFATTSSTNNNTAVGTDIAGLSFTAEANKTYRVVAQLSIYTAATTTGLGVSIKATGAPSVSQAAWYWTLWYLNSTSPAIYGPYTSFADTPAAVAASTTWTTWPGAPTIVDATFTTTSAGTIQLTFRTEVNSSAVTVSEGSYLQWRVVE